jgi:hypothetical protein
VKARALCVLLAGLMLAGCGSDGSFDKGPAPSDPASKRAAADLAVRYVQALVSKDWATACKTRTTADQQRLADAGNGSCARAFAQLFKERPTTDRYVGVRAGEVRVKGPYAGIDMIARGESGPRITLGAVREHGEWRIKDLPKYTKP